MCAQCCTAKSARKYYSNLADWKYSKSEDELAEDHDSEARKDDGDRDSRYPTTFAVLFRCAFSLATSGLRPQAPVAPQPRSSLNGSDT
jgi:hypothetical protein